MTRLRQRVLEAYSLKLAQGYYPTHAELSRDCGLYSYRDARRVLNDLKNPEGPKMISAKDAERFWSRVDKSPGHGPNGDCWEWTGAFSEQNYPRRFGIGLKTYQASHVAMMIDGRPRPNEEMHGLHSCDNKKCVNPHHLRWGTTEENHQDWIERGHKKRWLSDEVVREIRASSERNFEIARRLGVTQACICIIRKGRSHKRLLDDRD